MITEDYVSFETAKLLKDKGFNPLECGVYYSIETGKRTTELLTSLIACPTQSMAMKWLRKKYKLCIVSIPVVTDDDGDGGCLWNYVISRKLKPLYESESLYESPETALNNAIKYCYENLI